MRIVLTGAAGRIGRIATEALSAGHELTLLDRVGLDDPRAVRGDLSESRDWRDRFPLLRGGAAPWRQCFADSACIVHLAGDPSPGASMESVLRNNVRAAWNVLEEAASRGSRRVVLASSSHAVLRTLRELAPRCYEPTGPKIGSDAPPAPASPYGLSKATVEECGRLFAADGRIPSVLALRIGWFASDPGAESDPELRHRWIGVHDMASLLRRCVSASFHGFHVAYAVSGQASSPFDLGATRELLSWRPRQSLEDMDARARAGGVGP